MRVFISVCNFVLEVSALLPVIHEFGRLQCHFSWKKSHAGPIKRMFMKYQDQRAASDGLIHTTPQHDSCLQASTLVTIARWAFA